MLLAQFLLSHRVPSRPRPCCSCERGRGSGLGGRTPAISQGQRHSPGQSPPLEHPLLLLPVPRELAPRDSAQISLLREPWHCRVSGTTALPVTLCSKEMWGQRCCPCPAAGLRRRKPARVKDEGWWCPGTAQPRWVPDVISQLSSPSCSRPGSPPSPSPSQRRGRADLGQHFGKVNATSGLVRELLARPGRRWEARLPRPCCCSQLPAGAQGLSAAGGFGLPGSPASIINRTNYLAEGRWAGGGRVVTAAFSSAPQGTR